MALFTKVNGIYKEVSDRLAIKEPGIEGHMDYEDQERMAQIAKMLTDDIDQTLRGLKAAKDFVPRDNTWKVMAETNPVIKDFIEKGDPATVKVGTIAAVTALSDRWAKMENGIQRKAEMLAVLAAEGYALKYSMDHNLLMAGQIPPFMITLWGRRF